ncbi:hypothetical protein [Allonocardiopsis opalescens]|uniref:hypothetical protein n=1 Tax=Allonocardiopsis opalescens TaxID=1144618 RepID=UPI001B80013A|nr:hypothetical protein [Allonocardiopsis opalescens]
MRRPLALLGLTAPGGLPFLVPEVRLHYKAEAVRPKEEADFAAALPAPGCAAPSPRTTKRPRGPDA